VIGAIGPEVESIYAVDDACPDGSGGFIEENNTDPRVRVLYHIENQGVGGAVITAYKAALTDGIEVVVKIDGDGQMNPALVPNFVRAIVRGKADYTKGNRFYRPESLRSMPRVRLLGNAGLSFINKISTGYWPIMDPTNGYTAIHAAVLRELPLDKMERGYFFESDMLYHLNIIRAVVHDVPMDAVYADESSNLRVSRVLPQFMLAHVKRFFKRYAYTYLIRDFNLGSIYSLCGGLLCVVGLVFGGVHWLHSVVTGAPATSGTVMLAALPLLVGIQLLIAFLHQDVSNVPTEPLALELGDRPMNF
jgi:glycosyltransferase involved in cell wall biosynthesis